MSDKKMKKILISILLVASLITVCSCSKQDDKETKVALTTSQEISIEPFDFGEYEYSFKIKIDNQELILPCTVGELIDAGFNDVNFSDDFVLDSGEVTTTVFLSNNAKKVNVTLSNPTNHNLNYRDIFVIGCDLELDDENTKIYPSKTDATQKFLYSKLGIEDSEIVLGNDAKWLGVGKRDDNNNPVNISYEYGNTDIFANVLLGFKDERLHNITIMFENLI